MSNRPYNKECSRHQVTPVLRADFHCATCARIRLEKKIVKRLVSDLLGLGFTLNLRDQEEGNAILPEPVDRPKPLVKQLFTSDDDFILVYKDGQFFSWVLLIYGNSGTDVISDHGTALDEALAPTFAWINTLEVR